MTWRCTEWLDCYVEDGQAVIMLASGRVNAVSPIAWSALEVIRERPSTTKAVSQTLVDRFGAPGEGVSPERLTEETLSALEDAGLASQVS